MVLVVLFSATFLMLAVVGFVLEALPQVLRLVVGLVVFTAALLIWIGYFMCFPRQAADDWRRAGQPA